MGNGGETGGIGGENEKGNLDARKLRKSTEFIDDDAFPGI
jgi:hypothetical protein